MFQYIYNHREQIINDSPYTLINDTMILIKDYIPKIQLNKQFSGDLELSQSIKLFNINIAVYENWVMIKMIYIINFLIYI